ncbi:MAG: hypothetical protein FWG94_12145 [Oscillospiraceae bacterium]|nr:hypothetical protein [Oscillospiraceae bacterium]
MDDWQNATAEQAASRLFRALARQFEQQQQNLTAQTNHIDRKRMREPRQKMQAQGHARDEQVQSL